jgi:hypothetical protein
LVVLGSWLDGNFRYGVNSTAKPTPTPKPTGKPNTILPISQLPVLNDPSFELYKLGARSVVNQSLFFNFYSILTHILFLYTAEIPLIPWYHKGTLQIAKSPYNNVFAQTGLNFAILGKEAMITQVVTGFKPDVGYEIYIGHSSMAME